MKPTVREQFESAKVIDTLAGHEFVRVLWIDYPICRRCGAILKRDRSNTSCRGEHARLGLRGEEGRDV